jgi:hypothetical protein
MLMHPLLSIPVTEYAVVMLGEKEAVVLKVLLLQV